MPKRILIVEDDYDILCLFTDALNEEGYQVVGFNYTASVLDCILEHQPDLVMLDFLLPGVNGGELCREIKTNEATAHLPVILLSALPRLPETFGDYGCDKFLAKPFDIDVLMHTVESCLSDNLEMV
jgi:DNA-binding response OmpR family regulator